MHTVGSFIKILKAIASDALELQAGERDVEHYVATDPEIDAVPLHFLFRPQQGTDGVSMTPFAELAGKEEDSPLVVILFQPGERLEEE